MNKIISLIIVSLFFVACGAVAPAEKVSDVVENGGSANEGGGGQLSASITVVDGFNAETIEEGLKNAGIAYKVEDETEKRMQIFSENNQPAIKALTKFKFGETSVQMSVVDLSDRERKGFVDADLLKMYNDLKAVDAEYTRSYVTLQKEDANTSVLLIFKKADEALVTQIEGAM